MIYYIADTHFGHANIIKHCNRPFETVEEMDDALIKNWNHVVSDKDTVYIVGDFAFRGLNWKEYAKKIRGNKIFLNGNHDKFEEPAPDMLTIKDSGDRIFLCHYPVCEWNGYFRGVLHFYGHIHNAENLAKELMDHVPNAYNIGADLLGFTPRTKDEIIALGKPKVVPER
ncbi:MAG: hydrolase [Lachnospiraceae bacterium]|nr:hydrolase [Lachnospiraceae bacterium]